MSRESRIFLGVSMLLLAAGFLVLAPFMGPVSPQAGPGMVACGIFCVLIAIACLSRTSRPVTIRLVGGSVFLLCLGYIVGRFLEGWGRVAMGPWQGLLDSLHAMALFGLPGAYVVIRGQYPRWGRHAAAFGVRDDGREVFE